MIPVTCVEHSRWRDISPRFAPGEASFFSLKREKHAQVTANLRASGRMAADQPAIWASLAERQAEAGVHSDTGAMNDLYRSREGSLHAYERTLGYVKGAVGMVVAINGRMAGAEVFDQPRTAEVLWTKLVRSYAVDALGRERGAPVPHSRAVRFLERPRDAGCEVYPSLALSQDVRLQGDGVVGSVLVYLTTALHVSLFRARDRGSREKGATGMARASVRRGFRSGRV